MPKSVKKQRPVSLKEKKATLISQCLVLYTLGLDYSQPADELATLCTDTEWNTFNRRLEQADEWMVDAGRGTIVQAERVMARRESRPARVNFGLTDVDSQTALEKIAQDAKRAGISYGDFVFVPAKQ